MSTARTKAKPKQAKEPAFQKGDRVVWSHAEAPGHYAGSIARASAIVSRTSDAQFGTVKKVANDEGTYFEVLIDGEDEPRILTEDELAKVAGEDELDAEEEERHE